MRSSAFKIFSVLFIAAAVFQGCRNEANEIQPTCFDEVRNQGELRADCGGPNCPECPPTCDDRIANQDEISPVNVALGIDCGGTNCEPCATCEDGIRNAHWVFDANLTIEDFGNDSVATNFAGTIFYRLVMEKGIDVGYPCPNAYIPTCGNGIQDEDELQGVDCGPTCKVGCPPTCFDGIQNGNETGVDCGSPECFVLGIICPDPTCNDGIKNIHIEYNTMLPDGYVVVVENGVDCDNNPLTSCPECPFPTCFDGIQNNGEGGIDCGANCGNTPCNPIANCYDGTMNGGETGVDCGGSTCPPCPTCDDEFKNGPELEVDCIDHPIPEYLCDLCPSCHDFLQNQFELDVDCGGPDCEPCEQYLIVSSIGPGGGAAFFDNRTYNDFFLLATNPDTLFIPNPLVIGPTQLFPAPAKRTIIAIQQINTPNGKFERRVELTIPRPDANLGNIPPTAAPAPLPLVNAGIAIPTAPSIKYTEGFITGPFAGTVTFFNDLSLLLPGDPASTYRVIYNYTLLQSGGYLKGRISFARLEQFPAIPGSTTAVVSELEFAIQYTPQE